MQNPALDIQSPQNRPMPKKQRKLKN
jgi:hypothetical protein